MELGNQIKKYRNELEISQEKLAEKIYVSRQSISNWENDKNYPDINSLIRLSEVFHISLDILIKGDVEKMKKEISEKDRKYFEKVSNIYAILFGLLVLTPMPLLYFLDKIGMVFWAVLAIVSMYVAFLVEKKKKEFDIQTYKEIIAFNEGKNLDEISKAREEGKRLYQKVSLALLAAIATVILSLGTMYLLTKFF
ncbi:helix-turn-helix domain-containing protein [Tissierella creatinophila]|uniref:HTH-type transcriptional regulator ImmR n=1 Tax=Tissierella creatinophila DSM 6911 TaxID=1123403 RepID=A0A1U7M3N9_TISCR|nr:helix-turn-helix transcriptional regulator [Tissierella creatinophila]OLS01933.1 HTH-type transcriptional regulator ImmR [Tissierella creatinophila DSM 6911]